MTKLFLHWLWDIFCCVIECVENYDALTAVAAAVTAFGQQPVLSFFVISTLLTAVLRRLFAGLGSRDAEGQPGQGTHDDSSDAEQHAKLANSMISKDRFQFTVYTNFDFSQHIHYHCCHRQTHVDLAERVRAAGGTVDEETMCKLVDLLSYLHDDHPDDFDVAVGS